MVFMVLVAIEVGLRVFYAIGFQEETPQQKVARISPYAGLEWPQELSVEEKETKPFFVPWIMWRHKEFHGKHITISPEGLRKTWNPPVTDKQHVKKVFFFGGSTTWGVGARDDFTIPSLLSQKLNQGGDRFVVVNYGERGYTLMQEVINLVVLLKDGNIPDYVIFYDGVNEVFVGNSNKKAGSFYGADTVNVKLFKMEEESVWRKLGRYAQQIQILQGVKDLKEWGMRKFKRGRGISPEEEKDLNRLADDIVQDYLRNTEFVRRLAQGYGFQYLFIWQPVLFTNTALTAEEKKLPSWNWFHKKFARLYKLVYDRMGQIKCDHFYNISTALDQKQKTAFFSWAHITEEGNEQVAESIYKIFQQEFPSQISAKPQGTPGRH